MAPKRKKSIKPLEECIKILETLAGFPSMPPKEAAGVYVACLAFSHHLAVDQNSISHIQKHHKQQKQNGKAEPFPEATTIPAMTAVVHNQSLFQALISCLKSDANDESGSCHSKTQNIPGARKRNNSIDLTHAVAESLPNKSFKLAPGQSPHAGKRILSNQSRQLLQQPEMNLAVLAAAILYVAFEPMDHWPVPLLEAYAEDSFGARLWVDDESCRLLVQNLQLAHSGTESHQPRRPHSDRTEPEDALDKEALLVADFYKSHCDESDHAQSPVTAASTKSPTLSDVSTRRGSLSSTASAEAGRVFPLAPSLANQRSLLPETAIIQSNAHEPLGQSMESSRMSKHLANRYDSDSGDDDEVAVAIKSAKSSHNDDSSSSSGEDEEMMDDISVDSSAVGDPPPPQAHLQLTYPVQPHTLKFSQVRQRYFGHNLINARSCISEKLKKRLEMKSKQNSGLLQTLPLFATIPSVRSIITANLEKWLQSPALSGLSRTLFSITVRNMKNVDPPLQEDLDSLDHILSMKLKANQLNAHVENVTSIAARIPTPAVANHIYARLMTEILKTMDSTDSAFSDHLSMIHAVHEVLPKDLQANGMASSLLGILTTTSSELEFLTKCQRVRKMNSLIRLLHNKFGASLDLLQVLKAISDGRARQDSFWTSEDEENRARLMLQLAFLLADPAKIPKNSAEVEGTWTEESESVRVALQNCRRVLLRWCCVEYAPRLDKQQISRTSKMTVAGGALSGGDIIGAGPADYTSVLDGFSGSKNLDWLSVMRCILFMEKSDSPLLRQFLSPDGGLIESDSDWNVEAERIDICWEFGADLDDDMIWTILKSSIEGEKQIPHEVALVLLEHLFHCCTKNRRPKLLLQDPDIMWKLYKLAEFVPDARGLSNTSKDSIAMELAHPLPESVKGTLGDLDLHHIPELAYSGRWWRVTAIALIMCGASPCSIGGVAWESHPTLKALIKMVTSDRYRFPTVDCDDKGRDDQKKIEQAMRDEEAKIAEFLFLPQKKVRKSKHVVEAESVISGSRASRRQQEKREKTLKKQREKEIAEERAAASRRKKLLRAAQKSITLLDPKKGPRKPPKESADLIFSVGEMFDLPKVFQSSTNPDFVLSTIGSTSRSAIERAYDWLIPIISFLPATISRLPASASCFLLLRAYGTKGEERFELQKLAAPLLQHVHDSLIGKFGEADSIRAFELLSADLSNHSPDRRRCARRVLQNAFSKDDPSDRDPIFVDTNHSWITNIIHMKYVHLILADAISRLGTAASFERGSNLRYLLLALHKLTSFAKQNEQCGDWDFPPLLMGLISRRPSVFASALSLFANLRSLTIATVSDEFRKCINSTAARNGDVEPMDVRVSLRCNELTTKIAESIHSFVPLSLLQSSCVLLCIWSGEESETSDAEAVGFLMEMLLTLPVTGKVDDSKMDDKDAVGLASARYGDAEDCAVSVEFWVMLAKSRSDSIAKRAALTAPTKFLPRLLLCSGLPQASLFTMTDRLGILGEKAHDMDKYFNALLVSSASSEWDIGRLGHRRDVARKLLGRITAYSNMHSLASSNAPRSANLTFLNWLSNFCRYLDKTAKTKARKQKQLPEMFSSVKRAGALLNQLQLPTIFSADSETDLLGDASDMTKFLEFEYPLSMPSLESTDDLNKIEADLKFFFEANKPKLVDQWLNKYSALLKQHAIRNRRGLATGSQKTKGDDVSFLLLQQYTQLERKTEGLASIIVSWVPQLSASKGSPKLWRALFADGQRPSFLWANLASRCAQVWEHCHVVKCRLWLLSDGAQHSLDLDKVVRFLINASTFPTIHTDSFADKPMVVQDSAWCRSDESVRSATNFALDCLLRSDLEEELRRRNNLPDCLTLLIMIGSAGRKQVQFLAEAVVGRLVHEKKARSSLLLVLLRLYACFPLSFQLGDAALRSHLTESVESCANDWLSWRSPLDDSLQDTLNSAIGLSSSSTQSLTDTAKQHPLLLLRKIVRMVIALENDGVISGEGNDENSGVVSGRPSGGYLEAKVGSSLIKIRVRHWGQNYTEKSWFNVLDVLSAVPNEVLFGCGLKMGLTDLLEVYLRLFYIQSQLHTQDRLSKLKERFAGLLGTFKTTNETKWDVWLACPVAELPSSGAIRNILMSCGFISQEDALENVKKTHS